MAVVRHPIITRTLENSYRILTRAVLVNSAATISKSRPRAAGNYIAAASISKQSCLTLRWDGIASGGLCKAIALANLEPQAETLSVSLITYSLTSPGASYRPFAVSFRFCSRLTQSQPPPSLSPT